MEATGNLMIHSSIFVWESFFQLILFGHPTSHSLLLYFNMKSAFCQNNNIGNNRFWAFPQNVINPPVGLQNKQLACISYLWHLWAIVVEFWLSWQQGGLTLILKMYISTLQIIANASNHQLSFFFIKIINWKFASICTSKYISFM